MKSFMGLFRGKWALLSLGVLAGMTAWAVFASRTRPKAPPPHPVRVQAWDKITPRLQQADRDGAQAIEQHLQHITDFFTEKQRHSTHFADDVLGWGGKWVFIKGKLTGDGGKSHQAFLRDAFERHLFTDGDLQDLIQSVVNSYMTELEGQENALLVAIRADLSEQDLPALRGLAAAHSDEAFRNEYRKMLGEVVPTVSRDLKITVGREAVVWVGSDIAAAVTVRIASAVAVRLGISGGILSTGAASGAATLGVGLIVAIIVDAVVDWVMRKAGYDPAGKIAGEVCATLGRIQELLVGGDAEANSAYQNLRRLQDSDPSPSVRSESRQAADRVENDGSLGLRHELNRLQQLRSRLREAALRKLIPE